MEKLDQIYRDGLEAYALQRMINHKLNWLGGIALLVLACAWGGVIGYALRYEADGLWEIVGTAALGVAGFFFLHSLGKDFSRTP